MCRRWGASILRYNLITPFVMSERDILKPIPQSFTSFEERSTGNNLKIMHIKGCWWRLKYWLLSNYNLLFYPTVQKPEFYSFCFQTWREEVPVWSRSGWKLSFLSKDQIKAVESLNHAYTWSVIMCVSHHGRHQLTDIWPNGVCRHQLLRLQK